MSESLRAIMVSVDYADILAITLPYNRHHFKDVYIVTTETDQATIDLALKWDCIPIRTDLFYRDGAYFNKWRALEYGLDCMGRYGWLCLMDADVMWPKAVEVCGLDKGKLYSPLRRMLENVLLAHTRPMTIENGKLCTHVESCVNPILFREELWGHLPIHRNVNEWAGYTQIFHADDKVLGSPPWHDISWKHAGGADSFFQRKWSKENKIRMPWNVLHLGRAGENWYGRSSRYLDGTSPKLSSERTAMISKMWRDRRVKGFEDEKLPF